MSDPFLPSPEREREEAARRERGIAAVLDYIADRTRAAPVTHSRFSMLDGVHFAFGREPRQSFVVSEELLTDFEPEEIRTRLHDIGLDEALRHAGGTRLLVTTDGVTCRPGWLWAARPGPWKRAVREEHMAYDLQVDKVGETGYYDWIAFPFPGSQRKNGSEVGLWRAMVAAEQAIGLPIGDEDWRPPD